APADPLRALLQRRQSEPQRTQPCGLRVEADAVVHDVEPQMPVFAADPDDHAACLRMAECVLHRFLRDPEHLRVTLWIGLELEIAFHVDLRRLYSPKHLDMLVERAAQSVPHA